MSQVDNKNKFSKWMLNIDARLVKLLGHPSSELPAIDYEGLFKRGVKASKAATLCVKNFEHPYR